MNKYLELLFKDNEDLLIFYNLVLLLKEEKVILKYKTYKAYQKLYVRNKVNKEKYYDLYLYYKEIYKNCNFLEQYFDELLYVNQIIDQYFFDLSNQLQLKN